jgi:hypothetical protein
MAPDLPGPARLEQLVLTDGQPNPACTSYLWLSRQFRRDSPDVERPQVWTNRPSVWSQRPFRHPAGPPCPASAAVLIIPGRPGDLNRPHLEGCRPETKGQPA